MTNVRFGMIELSFSFERVTMFEDPAYQVLIEKILGNKSVLLKEFEHADKTKSGIFLPMGGLFSDKCFYI